MNKFSIMTKSMMLAIGIVGVAHADHSFSYSNLLNNWTGWYAGMNAGVAFNTAQLRSQQLGFTSLDEACHTTSKFFTVLPGGQIGYMHQFPNELVSGIEANFTFNIPQKNTFTCLCEDNPTVSDGFAFRNRWQSSIKARMGRALNWGKNSVFPYLTAGASFADLGLTYKNEGRDDYSKNALQMGWLIGTGIEWAFQKNWSVRAEYYYVGYGNTINLKLPSVYALIDPDGNARVKLNSHNIMVAINYWF